MTHVADKAPTKWRRVGIQLRIQIAMLTTLNAFKTQEDDPTELYIKVFEQWESEIFYGYSNEHTACITNQSKHNCNSMTWERAEL